MTTKSVTPPRLASSLIRFFTRSEGTSTIQTDLDEYFQEIAQEKNSLRAGIWYWNQVLKSLFTLSVRSLLMRLVLLGNYVKIAVRALKKQKLHTFINIFSLAVGLTCCILISLFVYHEFNYDRYHFDQDRIYRVIVRTTFYNPGTIIAETSDLVLPEMLARFPQIEAASRLYTRTGRLIRSGDNMFYEDQVFFAEPDLFQILSLPLLEGSAESLHGPGNIILAKSMAEKLFGSGPYLDQKIEINDLSLVVSGVVSDPPSNSHLQYSCFASYSSLKKSTRQDWTRYDTGNYIRLKTGVDVEEFGKILAPLTDSILSPANLEKRRQVYLLQPIADIHLSKGFLFDYVAHGNRLFLFILAGLGLVILAIACVNFVNLTTAHSATRSKEVGVRKVIGAQKRQLAWQFLGETGVLAVMAFILAFFLAFALLPRFSSLTAIPFSLSHLLQPDLFFLWIGLLLCVGFSAGLYPALLLSSCDPNHMLRHRKGQMGQGKSGLRRLLIVAQFSASIFLVIVTLTMSRQIHYMKNRPLGFNKEQKLVLPFPRNIPESLDLLGVKNEFSDFASIRTATLSSGVPGRGISYAGTKASDQLQEDYLRVYSIRADEDFFSDFEIEWATASLPKAILESRLKEALIVNESLVAAFGWSTVEEAIGKKLNHGNIGEYREIIGVIRDFHFQGLHEPISPLLIYGDVSGFEMITLTVDIRLLPEIFSFLRTKWKALFPAAPFEYFFLDENFNRAYQQDEKVSTIVSLFSVLGVSIACFGLLGLAALMAERRTKEIGIRKVLGSSIWRIVSLLTREFSLWVILSNLVAWPIAYFVMSKWLQGFHYRIALHPWIFFASGALALILAWLTVGFQTIKAAAADPITSLRYE
ncbi:ABC transporter permease [Acidobacteriota bacterium]